MESQGLENEIANEDSVAFEATDDKFSSSWVRELCRPIECVTAQEDPRYGDNYVDIKHEIDKLSGSDYSRVFTLSKKILGEEAKDLRVAGYLVLSGTHRHGVEGLINGLEVYRDLLERYWEVCFPRAALARANAISWLNNNKITYFLQRNNDDLSQETLDTLRELVLSFNQLVQDKAGESAQTFTEINAWLETAQLRVDEYKRQQEDEKQRLLKLEQERLAHEQELARLEELETDKKEREEQIKVVSQRLFAVDRHRDVALLQLSNHLFETGDFTQAIMHNRACRWSLDKLPKEISEQEVSTVEFPPEIDFSDLLTLDDPRERLQASENLFLLPGGEFCFRLQMISYLAAREMHDKTLALTLKQMVADWLDKYPALQEKAFANGTMFVDEECREWVDEIVHSRSESSPLAMLAGNAGKPDELDLALRQAHEIVEEEDLNAGIRFISNLTVNNELDRVKQKLNMALLCFEQSRSDLALPVLNDLFVYTNSHSLHIWQPGLAMVLWKTLYAVLEEEKDKANEFFKQKIDHKLKEVSEMMCTADLSMASQLLNQ